MNMVLVGSFAMATSISRLRLCALIQTTLKMLYDTFNPVGYRRTYSVNGMAPFQCNVLSFSVNVGLLNLARMAFTAFRSN